MARYHHRRWGRDAVTGGKKFSTIAAVAGFLVAPAAVGMLATIATKPAAGQPGMAPQKQAQLFAGAHAAAAVAAWYGAKKFGAAHSFLRGAMYGEGVVTAIAAYEVTAIPAGTTAVTAAPSSATQAQLQALADKLVKGSWFKA